MNLKFLQPATIQEALELLTGYGDETKVLAGGTAVVLMMQHRLIAPSILLSLDRIPDLNTIHLESDGFHVGPMTLLRDIESSQLVRDRCSLLASACSEVGNVRVRNQATLGGNLAEADYASDPPAALLALDAQVTATSLAGSRRIPLADFFLGFYTTVLEPDELITECFIPVQPEKSCMTYLKYKSRSSEDRPCVGVAAVAAFDDETCVDLRIAVGAASEVPQRLPEIENFACDETIGDELIAEIANGYANNIETLDDIRGSSWYRTEMIRVHVRRALEKIRNGRG